MIPWWAFVALVIVDVALFAAAYWSWRRRDRA